MEVLLGEVAEDDANETCEVDYLISKWTWTNDYPFEEYSKGLHIADFTPQVIDYYSTAFAACLPNMEGHEFEQAEENARYNPFGRKGFLFKVQKGYNLPISMDLKMPTSLILLIIYSGIEGYVDGELILALQKMKELLCIFWML